MGWRRDGRAEVVIRVGETPRREGPRPPRVERPPISRRGRFGLLFLGLAGFGAIVLCAVKRGRGR